MGRGGLKARCNLEPLSSGISSSACVIRRRESAEHLIRLIVIPTGGIKPRHEIHIHTAATGKREKRENRPRNLPSEQIKCYIASGGENKRWWRSK